MIRRYVDDLRAGRQFAHAAYRDGEWKAILGEIGSNVDGTDYDRALGKALADTLTHPVGQRFAFWPGDSQPHIHADAVRWLAKHAPPIDWLLDCPIRRANERGEARPFFQAVRERSVVVVGGPHLRGKTSALEPLIGSYQYVPVHPTDSWKEAERIAVEVHALIRAGSDLVLFAAGMGSCLMIARLWPAVRDQATLLDVGAILDPYAGRMSRRVYRDPAWWAGPMQENLP